MSFDFTFAFKVCLLTYLRQDYVFRQSLWINWLALNIFSIKSHCLIFRNLGTVEWDRVAQVKHATWRCSRGLRRKQTERCRNTEVTRQISRWGFVGGERERERRGVSDRTVQLDARPAPRIFIIQRDWRYQNTTTSSRAQWDITSALIWLYLLKYCCLLSFIY